MLRVQSLDYNIITGTFRVETCIIAGPKAAERGSGQHLMVVRAGRDLRVRVRDVGE